jgi:peptidoglycan LD-endopeptidase CwlK
MPVNKKEIMSKKDWELDPHKQCRDLNALDPIMYKLVNKFLDKLDKAGIKVLVVETVRTKERQKLLYAEGKSKTLNSKHFTGLAVDLCPLDANGKCKWDSPGSIWDKMAEIWESLDTKNIAGRFFPNHYPGSTFIDSPHFEHKI